MPLLADSAVYSESHGHSFALAAAMTAHRPTSKQEEMVEAARRAPIIVCGDMQDRRDDDADGVVADRLRAWRNPGQRLAFHCRSYRFLPHHPQMPTLARRKGNALADQWAADLPAWGRDVPPPPQAACAAALSGAPVEAAPRDDCFAPWPATPACPYVVRIDAAILRCGNGSRTRRVDRHARPLSRGPGGSP